MEGEKCAYQKTSCVGDLGQDDRQKTRCYDSSGVTGLLSADPSLTTVLSKRRILSKSPVQVTVHLTIMKSIHPTTKSVQSTTLASRLEANSSVD